MRIFITFALLSFVIVAACTAINGNNQNARNLILSEQELRFAGNALRTVLGSNINSYRGKKGSRRFSGTFSIVEKENSCGDFDVRINADVELVRGSGGNTNNENRNRYPNNNYRPNNNNNYNPNNNFGNTAQAGGGYAGQFNY